MDLLWFRSSLIRDGLDTPKRKSSNLFLLFVMFLFLLLLFVVNLVASSLESVVKRNPDHVFPIEDFKDYQKHFMKSASKNRVLLVVVGEAMKAQCPYCGVFAEQFKFLAKNYYEMYHSNLVFSLFEYEEKPEYVNIVKDLRIQSVPTVMLFSKKTNQRTICPLQQQPIYECIKTHFGLEPPQSLKGFISEQKRQRGQQRQQGRPTGVSSNYYVFLGISTFLLLILSYTTFKVFRSKYRLFTIYMILMAIFVLCCGCTVYNMIQTPGPNYGTSIIYPQQRVQMYYEGYVAAFIIVLFSLSWIGTTEFLRTPIRVLKEDQEDDEDDSEEEEENERGKKKKKKRRRRKRRGGRGGLMSLFSRSNRRGKKFISYFLVFLVVITFFAVFHMYIVKYRYYLNDIPYWGPFVQIVGNLPFKNLFEWYSVT